MKFSTIALATTAFASHAAADLCSWDTLLGLGSPRTLPYTFNLIARQNNNITYPIVQSPEAVNGFFFPLSLGAADTPLSDASVPVFTLQGGTTYINGGLVASTMGISLLAPIPLYASADSEQVKGGFSAVNASCGGVQQLTLRFTTLLPVALGSAAVNNSFAAGSALLSPIVDNALTLFSPVDLIIVPISS